MSGKTPFPEDAVIPTRIFPTFAAHLGREAAFPVGRVFGVPVEIHPSAFFAAVVIGASLGTRVTPVLMPDHSGVALWIATVATTLALFGSALAHELGHAVSARVAGVGPARIRLWLLGGTTSFRRPPGHPASDSQAALGGPSASFILAALFLGTAYGTASHPTLGYFAPILALLGMANALGASVNLLPAFPLDGGRVLRAALWRAGGSRARATRLAARSGGIFGVAAVATGLAIVLRGSPVGWALVMLGWFVGESAGRAEEIARVEEEAERLAVQAAAEIEAIRRQAAPPASISEIRVTQAGTYEPAPGPEPTAGLGPDPGPEPASRGGSLHAKRPSRKRAPIPDQPPSTPKSPPVQGSAADDADSSNSSSRPGNA